MKKTPLVLLTFLVSVPFARAQLSAHVDFTHTGGVWEYTLFNDEPRGSNQYLASFALDLQAAIVSVAAPTGWDFDTDYSTYVLWFSNGNPSDVAPQASLGGFVLTSAFVNGTDTLYGITAWDHSIDDAGPTTFGLTQVPTDAPPSVPGPAAIAPFVLGMASTLRRRRRA